MRVPVRCSTQQRSGSTRVLGFERFGDQALAALRGLHTVPLGAYANNGHEEGDGWAFTGEYPPARYLEEARRWVELGAQILGGCCGTTPEHIRALREGLPARLPRRSPGGSPGGG